MALAKYVTLRKIVKQLVLIIQTGSSTQNKGLKVFYLHLRSNFCRYLMHFKQILTVKCHIYINIEINHVKVFENASYTDLFIK